MERRLEGTSARGAADPELLYDMYLDVVYLKGIFDITFARNARWGHVVHAEHPTHGPDGTEKRESAEVTS